MTLERLQKVIAKSGLTSRRKAERLIEEGRVKVNHQVVTTLGTKVSPTDKIEVDEIPIHKEKKVYFVLHKPRGYISSVKDEKDRETVIDLLPEVEERIFPIGRLDYTSSGILLLTNDGEFAHLLMHPKHEIEKVYIVKVKGIPSKDLLTSLIKGVKDEGELLSINSFRIISSDKKKQSMVVEFRLHEGKNRHLRRMMEHIGYPILKLRREKFGHIQLGKLQPGQYRPLTRNEIHQLKQQAMENVKE